MIEEKVIGRLEKEQTMKYLGIPFSPMVFIPFMGAAVAMRQRPKDAYEEALVAFGGPVLGSIGALGFAGVRDADEKANHKRIEEALKDTFRPEFINRIDEIRHPRTA